jgi:acetoin utilization deacetylase AcuC-like enzyme
MEIALRHARGRVVSVLEGGYHLEGLARSAAAHVAALMGA